ncbi:hypothetical protein CMV37_06465 [Bacillus cereus]|nr:hypothetical protein CMV37_06465 [Bacillus cereus]
MVILIPSRLFLRGCLKSTGSDGCRISSLRMLARCSSSNATLRSSWLQRLDLFGSLNPPFLNVYLGRNKNSPVYTMFFIFEICIFRNSITFFYTNSRKNARIHGRPFFVIGV